MSENADSVDFDEESEYDFVSPKQEFETLKAEQFSLEDKLKVIIEEFELHNSIQVHYAKQKQKGSKLRYSPSKLRTIATKTKEQQLLSVINTKFRMRFNSQQIKKALQIVKDFEKECQQRNSKLVQKYKDKLELLQIDENLMYVEDEADNSEEALASLKTVYNHRSRPAELNAL